MSEPVVTSPIPSEPASPFSALLQRHWRRILTGAGALLTLLGSVLPWSDAPKVAYGARTVDGVETLGLRQGLAGGDAWLTIIAAAAVTLLAVLMWRRPTRPRWYTLIALSLFAACWPIASATSIPGDHAASVGIWITCLGGLAMLVGAAAARPDRDDLYDADVARVFRLWKVGRLPDAIAVQQRVLTRDLADRGWSRESGLNALILATLLAETGNRQLCEELIHEAFTQAGSRFDADDQRLAETLRSEIGQTLVNVDQAGPR